MATYFCLEWWSKLALLLSEDDVRALLSVPRAIALLEDAFRLEGDGQAVNGPRRRIRYPGGVLHYMAAALPPRRSAGMKAYVTTGEAACFVALLWDSHLARLLAILEADWLGRIRTGAASGLATQLLARSDARIGAVIGTGGQADTQVEAMAAVRPLEEIRVYSRSQERREALVRRLSGGVPCTLRAVSSAREAVVGADVVTAITNAAEPVFDGSWLSDGCHVNAAGSNAAGRREIDVRTVQRATYVVVDSLEGAEMEAGDLIAAVQAGVLSWDDVREMGSLVAGSAQGRTADGEITLYESQGVAIEDVAVAREVYERAVQEGRGQQVDFGGPGA